LKILTSENTTYNLDFVPDEIDDIRYCVLDYSDKTNPDYYFMPLVFLEIFNAPAAVLQIGEHTFKMPIDWSIIICDSEVGEPEIIPITALNDRGFTAFALNPINSYMPSYPTIEIVNIYSEVKWHFPKLKQGHILAVPLSDEPNSLCAYFVKETAKIPDVLDISELW
jgi:hypothetical protein